MSGVGTPLLAGRRAAARKPASLPATAPSPRLAAPPPMPSSLAPARCSEATPDELEERLRFFARQIKTFRRTSFMYSSPELMERIRQMEGDYETASSPRQDSRELLLLQSTPGLQGAAAAAEQSTPGLQSAVELSEGPEGGLPLLPGPEDLLSFLWGVLTELKPDTPQPASAHATEGPADASAPSLQGFSGKMVLVLASEPCDEGFEEEAPPDPVSGVFKEQFVLVLASERRDEGSPGAASASEGSPGAASASEGSPGAASASEGSPGAASASEGSPGIPGRPPELCACSGRPNT
ncbi:hypothetical protein CRENBAI_002963 [Crenichthys baileyi]|uniref:Uncharacterized protein n=1 Tax=Crenichthys baileyi TaxID=28760 RepID=A0AAV9R7Z3_9TELE